MGRIVAILLYLRRKQFMDDERFVYITQEEIAHMPGANRENVTKILNDLQAHGCIELHHRRIKVLKIESIQGECFGSF